MAAKEEAAPAITLFVTPEAAAVPAGPDRRDDRQACAGKLQAQTWAGSSGYQAYQRQLPASLKSGWQTRLAFREIFEKMTSKRS
jgi:hypothetical protein